MSLAAIPDPPRKNVQVVQEMDAAFARRDIGAMLTVISPDVEWGETEHP